MTDDPVFGNLRRALDQRIEPEPTFADGLFEELVEELGYRGETSRGRHERRALSFPIVKVRRDTWSRAPRLARLAVVAAVLTAVALGVALVGGYLLRDTIILTADQIVQRSQALYPNPPAFDMTVELRTTGAISAVKRFRYDGATQLRTDFLAGSADATPGPDQPDWAQVPGSFRIDTATQTAIYDAGARSWNLQNLPAPRPPLFTMFPLNWIAAKPFRPPEPPPGYDCPSGWQRNGDGLVADRPAYHVSCGSTADFWIDRATLLVVGSGDSIAATRLSVDSIHDPAIFALASPAEARDANNPPASTVLEVGQVAPDWTDPLQGGGTFDSRTLRGSAAAFYFWAEWCEPCIHESLDTFAMAARVGHPGIRLVSVAYQPGNESAIEEAIGASGGGFTVVRDQGNGTAFQAWGLTAVPALVLLRPDGSVADVRVGPLTALDLNAALTALAAGLPIPAPAVTESPCTCPSGATAGPTFGP